MKTTSSRDLQKTENRTEYQRPLLASDEVIRIGSSEAIIRTGNRRPMRLLKLYYDEEGKISTGDDA